MVYGYARISRKEQNIERQVRNIYAADPTAHIVREIYTGTHMDGRRELERLCRTVKAGDKIIFDSVSRMSRNADEGMRLYEELLGRGVDLVFLREPHINTETYKEAQCEAIGATGDEVIDVILDGINKAIGILRRRQIIQAFAQAEKEVEDLHRRTREGIQTARFAGKQIGHPVGSKLSVKKAAQAKIIIRRHSKSFGGSLDDAECMQLAGVARNTYYKYKREIRTELTGEDDC